MLVFHLPGVSCTAINCYHKIDASLNINTNNTPRISVWTYQLPSLHKAAQDTCPHQTNKLKVYKLPPSLLACNRYYWL